MCRYIIAKTAHVCETRPYLSLLFTLSDLVKYSLPLLSHREQYTQRQKVIKLQYIHYGLRHLRNFNYSLRQLPFLRLRLKVCTGLGPLFCAQHGLLMKDVTEQWHNVEIVVAMAGCRYRARNRPAKSPSSHRSGGGDEHKEA